MRALKKSNIANRVVVARDGVEALDYLFGREGDGAAQALPQLILLDLKLPKIDGHEVLKRIRSDERTRLLPVVILTTSVEDKDRLDGYRLGANSYIRKPVDFAEFVEAVAQLGLYWLVLNQSRRRRATTPARSGTTDAVIRARERRSAPPRPAPWRADRNALTPSGRWRAGGRGRVGRGARGGRRAAGADQGRAPPALEAARRCARIAARGLRSPR